MQNVVDTTWRISDAKDAVAPMVTKQTLRGSPVCDFVVVVAVVVVVVDVMIALYIFLQ